MITTTLIQIIALILPVGIFYGATNSRIKALEKEVESLSDVNERLARIEEKLNVLLKFGVKFEKL
jgi:hypothetical protein